MSVYCHSLQWAVGMDFGSSLAQSPMGRRKEFQVFHWHSLQCEVDMISGFHLNSLQWAVEMDSGFSLAQSPVGSRSGFGFSLAQSLMGSRNGFQVFTGTVSNRK